jgi:hypothetical protein
MRSLQQISPATKGRGTTRTAANLATGDSVCSLRPVSLGLVELKRVFKVQFDQLESQGYFQGDLECPGAPDPRAECPCAVQGLDLCPVQTAIAARCEEDLFATIKFLHNHVSKPKRRPRLELAGGAWRYLELDRDAGRARFRQTINRALGVYKCGFELLEQGDIVPRSRTRSPARAATGSQT